MVLSARLSVALGLLVVSVAGPVALVSPAYATPVTLGVCVGQQGLVRYGVAFPGSGPLTDQTQTSVREHLSLLRDNNNAVLSGACAGSVRQGDYIHPAGGNVGPLTPISMNASLVGDLSCANNSAARAADGNASAGWLAAGSMTWEMQQRDDHNLHYRISAVVTLSNPDADTGPPDTVTVSGIVRSGVNFGAIVSGTLWMDPVSRNSQFLSTARASNFSLDLNEAADCADTTANASVPYEMFGGGDGTPFGQPDTSTSLLGSTASGITFTMG